MRCTAPLDAWYPRDDAEDQRLTFNPRKRHPEKHGLPMACGKCFNCRASVASQWGTRCSLEMEFHDQAMFVTLTYDPEHLPSDYSVHKREFQGFMKRLRWHIAELDGPPIRFIGSGEYGGKTGRPHYHALIFGWSFPDAVFADGTEDKPFFTSDMLTRVWSKGRCNFSPGSDGVAHYVAGYTVKKLISRAGAVDFIDGATGEVHTSERNDEFLLMSRNPGIGFPWLEAYAGDLEKGFITVNGKTRAIPKGFLAKLRKTDPELFERLRDRRRSFMIEQSGKAPEASLWTQHQIGLDKLAQVNRDKSL